MERPVGFSSRLTAGRHVSRDHTSDLSVMTAHHFASRRAGIPYSNGLWDTVIGSLYIVDEAGSHVLAGTPTGIYETVDGASSWRLMP